MWQIIYIAGIQYVYHLDQMRLQVIGPGQDQPYRAISRWTKVGQTAKGAPTTPLFVFCIKKWGHNSLNRPRGHFQENEKFGQTGGGTAWGQQGLGGLGGVGSNEGMVR